MLIDEVVPLRMIRLVWLDSITSLRFVLTGLSLKGIPVQVSSHLALGGNLLSGGTPTSLMGGSYNAVLGLKQPNISVLDMRGGTARNGGKYPMPAGGLASFSGGVVTFRGFKSSGGTLKTLSGVTMLNGAPTPNKKVYLLNRGTGERVATTRSDEQGRYSFPRVGAYNEVFIAVAMDEDNVYACVGEEVMPDA